MNRIICICTALLIASTSAANFPDPTVDGDLPHHPVFACGDVYLPRREGKIIEPTREERRQYIERCARENGLEPEAAREVALRHIPISGREWE